MVCAHGIRMNYAAKLIFKACLLCTVLPLYAAPGDLDTTFAITGKIISAYGGPTTFGPAVKVQTNGRIVVAGKHYNGTDDDFVVLRYLSNGTLDPSFGSGGVTLLPFYDAQDNAKTLDFQTDGKILVAGEMGQTSGYGNHGVVRLNANGTIDTTFGTGGKVTTDFGRGSHIHSLVVQSDGKVVVAGESYRSTTDATMAVVRYLSNGALDTSFARGGKLEQTLGTSSLAHGVVVQPDGKVLIGGVSTSATTGKNEFFVARYLSTGANDTSFGNGGSTSVAIGVDLNYSYTLLLQSDGKVILVGGAVTSNGTNDFAMLRLNANGTLDSTFGSGGIVTTEFTSSTSPSVEEAASAVLQPDGKIILAGYSSKKFAVARYLTTGALDTSFGAGGKVTLAVGTGNDDWVKSVALQPDGKIVTVGYSKNGATYAIALARFQNDSGGALSSSDRIFNWAEATYPTVFPKGPLTQPIPGFIARIYPIGNAIGTASNRVYVYGSIWGGLADLGTIDIWLAPALAAGY